MIVPLLLFLRTHSVLIPKVPLRSLAFIGLVGVSIVAAVGTFERTGLVGLFLLAVASWLRARRKVLFLAGIMVGVLLVGYDSSDRWSERMQTINAPTQDSSALTRLLVWDWTWRYVQAHPLGGGFNAYVKSVIVFPGTEAEPEPLVVHGRAFHSVYFELLGEQGFVGIGLFLALVSNTMLTLQGIRRRTRFRPDLAWCPDLAGALQVSLLVLLACGAFIGIAFQPMFYMLFATSVCLQQHVRKALTLPLALRVGALPLRGKPAALAPGRGVI
jgi:putative inorganic carbon (HCO3(-)) transporter